MREKSVANCGCLIAVLVINLLVGGWSVNLLLDVFLQKTLPIFWAEVIGLFVGEFSIPVAVVVAILRHFGIV